jgi:hypothetical protein
MVDSKPPKPREPTIDELLALMHADEIAFWKSGSGSPKQREEFLEGIKERWRNTPVNSIPQPSPSEEELRRSRIQQAYLSGRRPDPNDLAEAEADEMRYQREVAEAREKKIKEVLSPQPPSPPDTPEKAKPAIEGDPKPAKGKQPKTPSKRSRTPKAAKKASPSEKVLERTTLEFYAGICLGVVLGVVPMNIILKCILLLVPLGLLIDICWRAPWMVRRKRSVKTVATLFLVASYIIGVVALIGYERYTIVIPETVKQSPTPITTPSTQNTPPTVLNASPSPTLQSTPVASPSIVSRAGEPTPSPTVTATPSRFTNPSHFNGQLSVKGGSPQRLSALLMGNGYTGQMLLEELTICDSDDSSDTLYLGQSNVNSTNGYSLLQGECYTQRAASPQDVIDATQIYLFIKVDGKAKIILRSK